MSTSSLQGPVLFVAIVVGQLTALALLPRTQGFTNPAVSVACAAAFVFSVWMLARLSHSGTALGVVIPLIAAVVPLGAIALGVLMYGESASPLKIVLLVSSCVLIGAASQIA